MIKDYETAHTNFLMRKLHLSVRFLFIPLMCTLLISVMCTFQCYSTLRTYFFFYVFPKMVVNFFCGFGLFSQLLNQLRSISLALDTMSQFAEPVIPEFSESEYPESSKILIYSHYYWIPARVHRGRTWPG